MQINNDIIERYLVFRFSYFLQQYRFTQSWSFGHSIRISGPMASFKSLGATLQILNVHLTLRVKNTDEFAV